MTIFMMKSHIVLLGLECNLVGLMQSTAPTAHLPFFNATSTFQHLVLVIIFLFNANERGPWAIRVKAHIQ